MEGSGNENDKGKGIEPISSDSIVELSDSPTSSESAPTDYQLIDHSLGTTTLSQQYPSLFAYCSTILNPPFVTPSEPIQQVVSPPHAAPLSISESEPVQQVVSQSITTPFSVPTVEPREQVVSPSPFSSIFADQMQEIANLYPYPFAQYPALTPPVMGQVPSSTPTASAQTHESGLVGQVVSSTPQQPANAAQQQEMGGTLVMRRGRGRPRKSNPYTPSSIASSSRLTTSVVAISDQAPPSGSQPRRRAGRPPGSLNRPKNDRLENRAHENASLQNPAGYSNVTPYVLNVNTGEDVTSTILSFTQRVNQRVSILSAKGEISMARISRSNSSGGTVVLQGQYEILNLGGSFAPIGGGPTRSGQMTVTLGGPGAHVEGGVASLLIASTPVQIVLAGHPTEGRQNQASTVMPTTSARRYIAADPRNSNTPTFGPDGSSMHGDGSDTLGGRD